MCSLRAHLFLVLFAAVAPLVVPVSVARCDSPTELPALVPVPLPEPGPAAEDEACDPLFDDCDPREAVQAAFPDPWEPVNRGILVMNGAVDRVVLDPITRGYAFLFPGPVRLAIRRLFDNLDAPSVAINDGLQLEWVDMGTTLTRFVLNSSIGIGGLFDPAAKLGLEGHHSDFGQTLALAGLPSGPYVLMPLLGPTTLRDGTGVVVDLAMSPLLYLLGPLSFEQLYRGVSTGLSAREEHFLALEALEASSIDFYAAMRSAFYQNRQAEIWHRREHRRPGMPLGRPLQGELEVGRTPAS